MSKLNAKIPFELDERPRLLWLNFNAMMFFEEQTGRNFIMAMSESPLPSITTLTSAAWAGLRHEDPELTLQYVGECLDLSNIEYVTDKILEAWRLATPDKKAKKAKLPNGTG
jgi:hypothetical protein